MRVRIRRVKECYWYIYVPEYKSAWYMPWRRITNKRGDEIYSSGNASHLEQMVKDVKEGKRKPRYPKPKDIKEY